MKFLAFTLTQTLGRYLVWKDEKTKKENRSRTAYRELMYGEDGLIEQRHEALMTGGDLYDME